MANDKAVPGAPGAKKTCGQRVTDFMNTMWNSEKKQFFGRGGASWAKIALFYIIFYSCLAGFFAIMMAGFFKTMSDVEPSLTGMYSLIKQNPGMGFRPRRNHESTLIKFTAEIDGHKEKGDYDKLINETMKFLRAGGYIDKDNKPVESESNDTYALDEHTLHHCPLNDFGFRAGQPCILLKMNKVFWWEPALVTGPEDNTTDWYRDAKKALGERGPHPSYVGVSCEGENDGDADNMGPVDFFPNHGFSASHYPYQNQKPYRAPFVFAKFQNPARGVVMQIWCKSWAKNIKHHKNDKGGSTHFELMVDGKSRVVAVQPTVIPTTTTTPQPATEQSE